ncbi:MAG: hypothetical protein HY553_04715 [Elusimicrobia bacterium]|nr:hypothetical protein [Elusimicrobiota bacterium]
MTDRSWLPRLLGLWLASFAGLLVFLYMFFIGSEVGGRSMFEAVFR